MHPLLLIVITAAIPVSLGFFGAPLWGWLVAVAAWLWWLGAPTWLLIVLGALAVPLVAPSLRRAWISGRVLRLMKDLNVLPPISATEQTAIEAGTVWVDRDLFSGRPDFRKLLREPYADLSAEERVFLDGPVEEACRLTDDWDVWQRRDLPPQVWDYLKRQRFFGIIVPKEFGGLGFSASANSAIVQKLSSRSLPLGISVMVPNSLGPAELLAHYGTPEQKEHYLPRLARGEEMPCFALTEPGAGSDATSISSKGVVFRNEDGDLCLRLTWTKRYISLAAVSTVLGLAVQLEDPDELLGKGKRPGITCVLLPSSTPGVDTSQRHDPLGVPFFNCPTSGKDVVVSVDCIIGGKDGAGRGWQMLTECLSAGRGISLPASATGGVKTTARVAGAHAAIRKQFGLPIGRFEGIEEPLARIGGFAYLLEAARRYTCGGLDQGAKPAVVTAIAKYNFTELARRAINDGMDVLGGNAISRGPRNLLAHGYIGMPISITVEGANILTRTLMVFGQGAIRCHPYAYAEIQALTSNDVHGFDKALWGHVGHVVQNGCRAMVLSLSRGWLAHSPIAGAASPYVRKLSWASAKFALLADLAMAGLGGDLKRKEAVTGRFADVFSWLYLATATIRRYEAEGRQPDDTPYMVWSLEHALGEMQKAFEGLLQNLSLPGATWLLRGPASWWTRLNPLGTGPSDRQGHRVAKALQTPGEARDRLTAGCYMPTEQGEALRRLEHAFALCTQADGVERKIKAAVKDGKLPKGRAEQLAGDAAAANIITAAELEVLHAAEAARADALAVDSFGLQEYLAMGGADSGEQLSSEGALATTPRA
ncbi:MAG: acyl-CoA dehydrogenase [Planctomycetota bacterium]